MPATPAQIALAKTYEPILLFHPDELYQPIDSKRWFEIAALWSASAPFTDKAKWGFDASPGQKFPRKALVNAGQAALVTAEVRAGQVDVASDPKYLLTRGGEVDLFLDVAGWDDSPNVVETSNNTSANLAAIGQLTAQANLALFGRRYAVEIVEVNAIEALLQGLKAGLTLSQLLQQQIQKPQLLLYYFLYPGHEQELLDCEIALSHVSDGNFSGDWSCVAILLNQNKPIWIGHSTHNAGLIEVAIRDLRIGMVVNPWGDASSVNGHPLIFVAKGTHGNWLAPGDHPRTSFSPAKTDISEHSCGAWEGGYEALRDAVNEANKVTPIAETSKDALVALAKVVAGAAIGGVLGAIAGGIAAIGEALATNAPQIEGPPPLPGATPVEETPPHPANNRIDVGRALRPAGLTLPANINANTVLDWNSNDLVVAGRTYPFVVIRSEQCWWPRDIPGAPPGYEGRWGVRVQKDPSDRRCGMQFPDFRRMFFRELLLKLTG